MPKPERIKKAKARKKRLEAKLATEFRLIVWLRDEAHCRQCGRWCGAPQLTPPTVAGHVHHLRGRNVAPEDRYNTDAAVLLCGDCHRAVHDGRLKLELS